MVKRAERVGLRRSGLHVALLCCLAYATVAFAGEKTYPLEGKVVALGTTQETIGVAGPQAQVSTVVYRTYTVQSQTRIYVLKCPYVNRGNPVLSAIIGYQHNSLGECGGTKKIAIGDVIHFRRAKNNAYIQTGKGKEQKLFVMSEAANEAPGKEETKP